MLIQIALAKFVDTIVNLLTDDNIDKKNPNMLKKKILPVLLLIFLFDLNNIIAQVDINKTELEIENQIEQRIDSILRLRSFNKNSLIESFDEFLVRSEISENHSFISNGYIDFYDLIKNPDKIKYDKSAYNNSLMSTARLYSCIIDVCNQFDIPENQYSSLQNNSPLKRIIDYARKISMMGEIPPFDFEKNIDFYNKNICKILFLSAFSFYGNYYHILKGNKNIYHSDFINKQPSKKIKSNCFNCINLNYYKLPKLNRNDSISYKITNRETDRNNDLKNTYYINLSFIIDSTGVTNNYVILDSEKSEFNQIAIDYLIENEKWIPGENQKGKVSCAMTYVVKIYTK